MEKNLKYKNKKHKEKLKTHKKKNNKKLQKLIILPSKMNSFSFIWQKRLPNRIQTKMETCFLLNNRLDQLEVLVDQQVKRVFAVQDLILRTHHEWEIFNLLQ